MSARDIDPYRIARQLRQTAAIFESGEAAREFACADSEVDTLLSLVRRACPAIAAKLWERADELEVDLG